MRCERINLRLLWELLIGVMYAIKTVARGAYSHYFMATGSNPALYLTMRLEMYTCTGVVTDKPQWETLPY